MARLAAAGAAPSQADIEEATRQYFANGAALTSAPASGPGSAYFHNGAEATRAPSSGPGSAYFHNGAEATAFYPAPRAASVPEGALEAEAGAGAAAIAPREAEAGVVRPLVVAEPAAPAAAAPAQPDTGSEAGGPIAPTGLTCSASEIEAAMALARQFAAATTPPLAAPSCAPATGASPLPPGAAAFPLSLGDPSPNCSQEPSFLSRLAAALGGAILGGAAVAAWSRLRALRGTLRR